MSMVPTTPVSFLDAALRAADASLRTLFTTPRAQAPSPASKLTPEERAGSDTLSESERKLSAALMRVNHVGEICAQALYQSQALATRDPALRQHFERAAQEEIDHLAWTQQRLQELGDRTSLLNPLWYTGAFALGLVMGKISDSNSLGFVVETERQVEAHLRSHLDMLPEQDTASRAIVQQMEDDERRHADEALEAGASPLPAPVQAAMKVAAKVMTTVAHRV